MRDLRLVAVTEDGGTLLLADAEGAQYSLVADGRVRAALRNDRERLGQLAVPLEGMMRPREIQSRIRAGESAEEIAAASGMPVDQVARFEGPVLGERAHVAAQARTAQIRRDDTPAGTLDELVTARLKASGINPDTFIWDSWRREDATWDVELTYLGAGGPARAHWLFDPRRRVVTPLDDDARWLTGSSGTRPTAPVRSVAPPRRETMTLLSSPELEPEPEREDDGAALTTLAAVGSPSVETGLSDDDQSSTPAGARGDDGELAEEAAADRPAAAPARRTAERPHRPAPVPGRGPRRAAVPSWDDIVFGTRSED